MSDEQVLSMEEMSDQALSGEITQEEFDTYLDGLNDASETGDSRPPESDTPPVAVAPIEDKGSTEEETEKEVVLAKDGKNVIPYEVLESARDELHSTKTELDALKQVVEGLKEAKDVDDEAGDTAASDELLADFEIDYPGLTDKLKELMLGDIKPTIETLKAEREEQVALTAEQQARTALGSSVDELLTVAGTTVDYGSTVADSKFWTWFDAQPSYVKAAEKSGDPQQIADVISLYAATVTGGDKPAGSKTDKVAEARAKAQETSSVTSISEIPGGSPYSTEEERVANMSDDALSDYLSDKDPDFINDFLNKHL